MKNNDASQTGAPPIPPSVAVGNNNSGSIASKKSSSAPLSFSSSSSSSSAAPSSLPSQRIPRRSVAVSSNDPAIPTKSTAPRSAIMINVGTNNNATVKNNANPATASVNAARVVPRPPLNVYLRVAIIRDDNDVVVCEDPEHPGRKKQIAVMLNQLQQNDSQTKMKDGSNRKEGENKDKSLIGETTTAIKKDQFKSSQGSNKNESNQSKKDQSNNNSNKKEIPVPTITTVTRYDTDIPPNYAMPPSYVRHVCPTYEQSVESTIEYNVDAEDERWWRSNEEFGPFSKAKIVVLGDDGEQVAESGSRENDVIMEGGSGAVGKAAEATEREDAKQQAKEKAKDKSGRNKKGKFVKKNSAKKLDDYKEDAMEIGNCSSSDTFPPSKSSSHHYTIEQVLVLNPKYLHSQYTTRQLLQNYNPKLPLSLLEQMMDILEKSTGFESIVTSHQALEILVSKLPELTDIFGPASAKERRMEEESEERYLARWLKNDDTATTATMNGKQNNVASLKQKTPLPTLAAPITLPSVIHSVYHHWMTKRSRLKKPLLRRFWPPTSATDTNPHQVFRQSHTKENKRRLRKKKQNDVEAYQKMKLLKSDFERVRVLCELILRREEVNKNLVELTNDYFVERLDGWMDTSGEARQQIGCMDKKNAIERVLNVPMYFADGPIVRVKGSKKRKRSSQLGWNVDSRDPSPIPVRSSSGLTNNNLPSHGTMKPPPLLAVMPPPKNIIAAGHDGGFPAPNFLQPLASRDSHPITSWEYNAVPSMPCYVNGKLTTQANKFRHRPRLGRGGRIVVDRVPCPSSSLSTLHNTPPTVITYGSPMNRSGYDISTLGADGPNYSINSSPNKLGPNNTEGTGTDAISAPKAPPAQQLVDLLPKSLGNTMVLSRRIEEICAFGLMEDYQTTQTGTGTASAALVASSKGGNTTTAASSSSSVGGVALLQNEIMDEVLVPIEDWMEASESMKIYGSEKFVIGPL